MNQMDMIIQQQIINNNLIIVSMKNQKINQKSDSFYQKTTISNAVIDFKKKNAEKDDRITNRFFGNDLTSHNNNNSKKTQHKSIIKNYPQQQIYFKQIVQYIKNQQIHYIVKNQQIQQTQQQIRKILVKYALNISKTYQLKKETLYLAIYIMDRFQKDNVIQKQKASIFISACLFIAMKYEQIYPPDLAQFVAKSYRKKVIEMESEILLKIDFKLNYFSSIMFFRYWNHIFNLNSSQLEICQFFLDIIKFDKMQKQIKPSLISLGVILLITKLHHLEIFIEEKQKYYNQNEIENCAKNISKMFQNNCDMAKIVFKNTADKHKINHLLQQF